MRNAISIGAASLLLSACVHSDETVDWDYNEQDYGLITIPSVVTSSSGTVYAFDVPLIEISGSQGIESLSFLSDGEDQVYGIDLLVGEYSITVFEPTVYRQEQSTGNWEVVHAELISDNPQWVTVTANETSHVQFVFMVNEEEVEFASGNLDIELLVEEAEPEAESPQSAPIDSDGDGLLDAEEESYGTDPNKYDTDSDGLMDGLEVHGLDTDPLQGDQDWDGLLDGKEYFVHGTVIGLDDSDKDGLRDGDEVHLFGTDPMNPDTDGDGLLDGEEFEPI